MFILWYCVVSAVFSPKFWNGNNHLSGKHWVYQIQLFFFLTAFGLSLSWNSFPGIYSPSLCTQPPFQAFLRRHSPKFHFPVSTFLYTIVSGPSSTLMVLAPLTEEVALEYAYPEIIVPCFPVETATSVANGTSFEGSVTSTVLMLKTKLNPVFKFILTVLFSSIYLLPAIMFLFTEYKTLEFSLAWVSWHPNQYSFCSDMLPVFGISSFICLRSLISKSSWRAITTYYSKSVVYKRFLNQKLIYELFGICLFFFFPSDMLL